MAHALSVSAQRYLSARLSFAARRGIVAALGVAFLALASRQYVPFVNTPIPFTWQPQAVLLLSALLGPGMAEATVMSWLVAAAMGAPVLAGLVGPAALVGPSAGYLLAYLPVSWTVARFGRDASARGLATWAAANVLILALGSAWLGLWVGAKAAFGLGFAPFAAADAAKAAVAFLLLARIRPRLNR